MTEQEVRGLVDRYSVGYYASPGGFSTKAEMKRAKEESALTGGLLRSIQSNIDEAKENLEGVRLRYRAAMRDGLFDLEALQTFSSKRHKKLFNAWVAAIETQTGDRQRAIAELNHWREYWTWAKSNPAASPIPIRELAERASFDARLPPGDRE